MQKTLTIILIVLLVFTIAVMLYTVYLLNQSQLILEQEITNLKKQVNQPSEQITEQEKAENDLDQQTTYQPVNVRYSVKMNADNQNQKMDFIVQNNFTGDSDIFISLDQGTNIFDQAEFSDDNLFISLVDTFGEYQIWRFDENKNKSVIFKSRQDVSFVPDQTADNIALIKDYQQNPDEFITIIDAKTGESQNITFTADQFNLLQGEMIGQTEFEYNSPNLWLLVNSPFKPRVAYSVNINTTEINEYLISESRVDSKLMPSRKILLFTDTPWLQDKPNPERIKEIKSQNYHVYALDLLSQEKELLATTEKGNWNITITIMDNNTFKFDSEIYRF
ncbi:MAG: hypothetical protein GF365_02175, partial [Candidatus Buchananbacteria bacterium]|nr:hypothetical protein [Candidatus Buchananbacteria bacterium]